MSNPTHAYGPIAPSKLALMGVRFIEGEDGANPAPAPAPTPTPPAQEEKDWKAEAERVLAESRKWESRAKENSKAAERLAAIEEEKKTAEQKLEERATKAEKDLADVRIESARNAVALEKGLTASQAKRLVGSTPEELAADADELLRDLGKPAPTVPKPDPSVGPKNDPVGGTLTAGEAAYRAKHPKK